VEGRKPPHRRLAGAEAIGYMFCVRAVLIAAKELAIAKTRLAGMFPDEERRLLAESMFRDVLAAAAGSRRADHVAVVTSDRKLLQLAREAGALTIDEERPRGLNTAVSLATAALVDEGVTALCTVLSDVPLTTADDIDSVFDATSAERGVVLVPSHTWTGTNLILRAPSDAIRTRFGTRSLARHREECSRLSLRCVVLPLARPALDLDVIEDLRELLRVDISTHTARQLARLGLQAP
jgi:2-phospho-L-lactate guanylyltransferase